MVICHIYEGQYKVLANIMYTSGDTIWTGILIGIVSEKVIFCFDSMMLLLHNGIIIMANYILNAGGA